MLALATCLLALGVLPGGAGDREQDFDRSLLAIQQQIRDGAWGEASAALEELLEAHVGQDHVWLRRPRIVEALQLSAFLPGFEEPLPRALVDGELKRYSPATGQMRLLYRNGELGDFNVRRESGEFEFGVQGELGEEDFLIHPALFQRGYSIKVRGTRYGGRKEVLPNVLCALSPWDVYLLCFGLPGTPRTNVPAYILGVSQEGAEVLDQDDSPAERGQPYELEVRVKTNEVLGLWSGRRVLRAKKDKQVFGQVGVGGVADWEEIEIAGVAQRSWMRGLQDEAFQAARLGFIETFDENAALPEWLRFEDEGWTTSWADRIRSHTPEEQVAELERFFELLGESPEQAMLYLAEESGLSDTNPALQSYVFAVVAFGMEDWEPAAEFCRQAILVDPDFVAARDLEAWIQARIEGPEKACELFAVLAAEHPGDARFRGGHAVQAFLAGDRDEARRVLREAVADGVYGAMLDAVSEALGKAETGPYWLESYVHETDHYRIVSDIDLRTCIEAGDILETALGYYEKHYQPLPKGADVEPFRVYIFSGETGYQLYLVNTILSPVENTAGVYVLGMEQLLIWNTPDREDMLATVRHEGLHQYVDRFMGEHPRWLGEGLGEYWEEADFTKGRSRQNAPTAEKLALMRAWKDEFTPLEEFLRIQPAAFYAEAGRHYVQSWAFVHFLQHGGREYRQLFDRLFAELASGTSSLEAVEAAFGDVDAEALERAFAQYLRDIQKS